MNQGRTSNIEYDNELNKRLETRNKPSEALQPLYEFRPVSTKYTHMNSKQNVNVKQHEPSQTQYQYDPQKIFNPGDRAPIDYFMKNIDVESTLRSQFFALQTSPQSVYVPETNSQLYDNPMAYHPDFFSPTNATTLVPQIAQNDKMNENKFYNCIRTNSKK